MKVLTKSRFKLALECPNKLYYTRKKEYADQKNEDSFLQALAQGGFQVEELARMHYPDGILIEGKGWDYEFLWKRTQELLTQENVVIFEAAFMYDHFFIRTDILVKKGNRIELIEVKSKSYDPADDYRFIGKKGGLKSGWKPYLFDVAFQHHVIQKCYPSFRINDFIMMADKSSTASVDGLNQMFRIVKEKDKSNRTGIEKKVDKLSETGTSVLGQVNISNIVTDIQNDKFMYHDNLGFEEAIKLFNEAYKFDQYLNWPTSYRSCRKCEFRTDEKNEYLLRSGFKECFSKQHKWKRAEFEKASTFTIWNFRKGKKLFNEEIFFMDQLTPELINVKEEAGHISSSERQWLQVEKVITNDLSPYVELEALKEEMDSWVFPLHFIDFETSAVALPFHKGRRPYEQIAFQFSHHIYYEDGRIEHASEYLNTEAGVFPNFDFVRHLKEALEKDEGTIFRYATHENTILNAIYDQLQDSDETDRQELTEFIRSITYSKKDRVEKWKGERDMVDLCKVIKWYYYNPFTNGSNGMKAVLPAILTSSPFLQQKYNKSLSENGVGSKNFAADHRWLDLKEGKVNSPYKMLPSLFEEWSDEELDDTLSGMEEIAEGGAALTAYAKLQFMDMSEEEREEINMALLKYCELDTLAMVMIYEHFLELLNQ